MSRVEDRIRCRSIRYVILPSLIKPCMRFSRTRLSDVLHRKACAGSCLALRYSFLCSVLITLRVASRKAIPRSSTLRLREQSRAPSLGEVYVGLRLKRYYAPLRLPSRPVTTSLPYTPPLAVARHRNGSPALGNWTSKTCRPCYPDGSLTWLPFSAHQRSGLPYTGTRSATA